MNKILTTYFWKDLWYQQVRTRINPRQKWLTDKIPRTWSDVDHLIETCVFESLIFFWEEDNGEESCRFQWTCEYGAEYGMSAEESVARQNSRKVVYDRLLAAYNWAKHGRHQTEEDLRKAIDDCFGEGKKSSKEWLAIVRNIETEKESKNTFFLKEIIELRSYMWN